MKTQKRNSSSKTAKKSTAKKPSDYLKKVKEKQIKLCVGCKPTEGQKYQSRPSPSCHAADCSNQMSEGNDGRIYISAPDAKGTYKWQPMTTDTKIKTQGSPKVYFTHDNGGRPFKVIITGRKIDIYEARYPDWDLPDKYQDLIHYEYRRTYQVPPKGKIFIGDDPENIYKSRPDYLKEWLGNSILAELSPGRYLFIGESVFEFRTANGNSGITLFRSPVGNNDVPYPFAMDDEYIYLLIENVRVAKTNIDLNQKPFDPYTQYYGHDPKYNTGRPIPTEKLAKTVVIPRQ